MPQYEVSEVGRPPVSGVVRARDPEDAVRRTLGLDAECRVEIRPAEGFRGWLDVFIEGQEAGQVRPHHRMRFRRD